ncbi:hypothetical protein TNCV_3254301 [Trichonephila clavipes]|nr:hypothetical protein TNCV_3254301 [Trichonephila clavipes]
MGNSGCLEFIRTQESLLTKSSKKALGLQIGFRKWFVEALYLSDCFVERVIEESTSGYHMILRPSPFCVLHGRSRPGSPHTGTSVSQTGRFALMPVDKAVV